MCRQLGPLDIDLTPLQIPIALSLDFLPRLQQALAERGLHYAVGSTVKNIEMYQVLAGAGFADV